MKRISTFILILSFVVVNNSCVENGIFFPAFENNGIFEVLIGGDVFSASEVTYVNDNDEVIITAVNRTTDEIFTLKLDDFAIGNYSLEGSNNVGTYVKNTADIWTTLGETTSRGNVQLTDIDLANNTISGTFSFIARNSTTGSAEAFTNGFFTNVPLYRVAVSGNSFFAKVDGVVFQEISLFGSTITAGSTNLINISANRNQSETINLTLSEDISVGEYDFASFASQTYPTGQYTIGGNDLEAEGKITITNHDTTLKSISGTFNFIASPTTSSTPNFTITEGVFSVSY